MEVNLSRQSQEIVVREHHDVGDARRQATSAAKAMGFNETAAGRVGIVATEIAGNLVKHAGGGTLILRKLHVGSATGLEILSIDSGPGMDVQRCLEDGYSTAGSPGTGLGAIKRMSDACDIYSLRSNGTVMAVQIWGTKPDATAFDIGAICLPVGGETECGDGWIVREAESSIDIVMSDGLGHGPLASQATDVALDTFNRKPELAPGSLVEYMHGTMRPTRGAAVLACHLNPKAGKLTSAGIGNIAGYIMSQPKPKGIVSMNGIVGHQVHKVKEFAYECGEDDVLILHSDGLTSHWKLDDFPGLLSRSSSLIAAMMYKHFKRGKDDATVLVVQRRAA